MRMHIECHAYEYCFDREWYECGGHGEPALSLAEALAYAARAKDGGAT